MEVMFHFIFTMVKIAVQASAYAALLLVIFRVAGKSRPGGWCDRVSSNKAGFWFLSGAAISVGLFCFLFSYWGFHGFGDGPRVPVGHGLFVDNTNWTEHGYLHDIKTSDGFDLMTTRFIAADDKLLGNLDSWFDRYANAYFIHDLKSRELLEFATRDEFNAHASANGLPQVDDLRTFEENYRDRWGGWWFWFLP